MCHLSDIIWAVDLLVKDTSWDIVPMCISFSRLDHFFICSLQRSTGYLESFNFILLSLTISPNERFRIQAMSLHFLMIMFNTFLTETSSFGMLSSLLSCCATAVDHDIQKLSPDHTNRVLILQRHSCVAE